MICHFINYILQLYGRGVILDNKSLLLLFHWTLFRPEQTKQCDQYYPLIKEGFEIVTFGGFDVCSKSYLIDVEKVMF